jgi:hypothetical protein
LKHEKIIPYTSGFAFGHAYDGTDQEGNHNDQKDYYGDAEENHLCDDAEEGCHNH